MDFMVFLRLTIVFYKILFMFFTTIILLTVSERSTISLRKFWRFLSATIFTFIFFNKVFLFDRINSIISKIEKIDIITISDCIYNRISTKGKQVSILIHWRSQLKYTSSLYSDPARSCVNPTWRDRDDLKGCTLCWSKTLEYQTERGYVSEKTEIFTGIRKITIELQRAWYYCCYWSLTKVEYKDFKYAWNYKYTGSILPKCI